MAEKNRPLMKDGLGPAAVERLGAALQAADPGFDSSKFQALALTGLDGLELKARVDHLIEAMTASLPADFRQALPIVLAAGEAFPSANLSDERHDFAPWPLVDWVAARGLAHLPAAVAALRRLTPLFSAEFAIRPFLLAEPEATISILEKWLTDPDHHVRRLVSEGTRPRLPWGVQLPMYREDPGPVLELLVQLRDDPSEYVRRSVANNLNDIAKDHPELVVAVAEQWWQAAPAPRQALIRHGLRSLVKQGVPGALAVLGFATDPKIDAKFSLSEKTLPLGESQNLVLSLKSTGAGPQKLVVDYIVHHQRSNGRMTAKVFKWRVAELNPGEMLQLTKSHAFVPRSVRRLYPGVHRIEVSVGGRIVAGESFSLVAK